MDDPQPLYTYICWTAGKTGTTAWEKAPTARRATHHYAYARRGSITDPADAVALTFGVMVAEVSP